MPMKDSCPTTEALQQFLLGYGSVEDVERLAAHFESCSTCLVTVRSLNGADLLLQTMRDPCLAAYGLHDQTIGRLIDSLRALWERPSPVENKLSQR